MIIYPTKQTKDRFNMVLESETIDCPLLLQFAIKIYYVNQKKCIQVVNPASKLTLVIYNVRNSEGKTYIK